MPRILPIADGGAGEQTGRMGMFKRGLVVAGSSGWLAPLCASYWASYDFIANVVWPAAAFGKDYQASWHPFDMADEFFYFAMLWLGAAVIAWSIYLSRPRADG